MVPVTVREAEQPTDLQSTKMSAVMHSTGELLECRETQPTLIYQLLFTTIYHLPFTICHRQPNGKLWPQPSDQLTTHQPGHIRLDLAMTALAFRPLIN